MSMKEKCYLESCDEPKYCKGLCRPHYIRESKYGDPQENVPIKKRHIYDKSKKNYKYCPDCSRELLRERFAGNSARSDGLASICNSCDNDRVNQWYDKNKITINAKRRKHYTDDKAIKARNGYLLRTYGISLDNYYKLLSDQNDVCAICDKPEKVIDSKTKRIKVLSVDHCHDTGRVRGLLCYRCNHLIGCLGDNEESFTKILNYLKG